MIESRFSVVRRSGLPIGHARRAPHGFTLLETSMALVVIGVGVLAFVEAQQVFLQNNAWSSHTATGAYLANEVRELSLHFSRHDPQSGLWIETGGGSPVLRGWGNEAGEVTADSFDDFDDLDGQVFGVTGSMPGPINARGEVISEIGLDGNTVLDNDGDAVPLAGWTQSVTVEKVDPFNHALVRPGTYVIAPNGSFRGVAVDRFPLRVTVIVSYQGPYDAQPEEITRQIWIVP